MIAALEALNEALCVRLRVHEVLPLPMSDYRIQDGRAHFVIPDMCELALSLTGPEATDYWHMVDIKFLARSDGDETASKTSKSCSCLSSQALTIKFVPTDSRIRRNRQHTSLEQESGYRDAGLDAAR